MYWQQACEKQGDKPCRANVVAGVEELEERVIAAVDCLKQKHSAQEEELEGAEIPGSRRAHVRASSLHYRRVEDALGHLQRYKEAQVVRMTSLRIQRCL